jgi:hypothetical protein
VPVPVKLTDCVPPPLPAFTFKVAVFAPTVVGKKDTVIAQVLLAGTAVPQVLDCEN